MKTFYIVTCLLCFSACVKAQVSKDTTAKDSIISEDIKDDDKIFVKVEQEAEFPGGFQGWKNYLMANLDANTPVTNKAKKGTYQVMILFIVSKDGSIKDVHAETSFGHGMEAEAIRVIKNGPKWIPAYQNHRPVNAYRRQPITFVVEEK